VRYSPVGDHVGVPENVEDQGSEYTVDEIVCMLGQTALMRLTEDLTSYWELLRFAREGDRQRGKPRMLTDQGKSLSSDQRHAVEKVVLALPDDLTKRLERSQAESESQVDPHAIEGKRHPFSIEQLVVSAILEIGKGPYGEWLAPLVDACGGSESALAYAFAFLRWTRRHHADRLATAIVPMAISGFESFFRDILRTWFLVNRERLNESKLKMELGAVLSYASLDDFRRAAADRRINEVVDAPPDDWQVQLRPESLDINFRALGGDWHVFQELFARRNVIIHNESRVDDKYVDRVAWLNPKPQLGLLLENDDEYVRIGLETLRAMAEGLAVAVLTNIVPRSKDLGTLMTMLTFNALRDERWADAAVIATIFLDAQPPDHTFHEVRVNRWMAMLKLGEDIGAEIEGWVPPADDSQVALGLAALRGDANETIAGLAKCQREGSDMRQLAEWPVLVDAGKNNLRVQKALLRLRTGPERQRDLRRRGKNR
jgi:hypothetical protein